MIKRLLVYASRVIPFAKSRGLVRLVRLVLPKDELDKLSALEKKRYLMVTCIMRDLVFLQKHLLFIRQARKHGGVEHSAEACSIVFYLTILVSKIHEARVFFERNHILEHHDSFSIDLKNAFAPYDKFFEDLMNRDLIAFIRDKIGFHYEYFDDIDPKIEEALENLPQIQMWLSSSDSGNDVFSSSNDILTEVIVGEMRRLGFQGNGQEQLMHLWRVALDGAGLTVHFCRAYLTEGFSVIWEEHEEVELVAPTSDAVEVPMLSAR